MTRRNNACRKRLLRWIGVISALSSWGPIYLVASIQHDKPRVHNSLSELMPTTTRLSLPPWKHHLDSTNESSTPSSLVGTVPCSRRTVVASFLIMSAAAAGSTASLADDSIVKTATIDANSNLKCLLDLPPIPEDCVRLYLCRHGQTENNRLRLVQGARVDPPLNQNGIAMSQRIGLALAQLLPSPVSTIYHSPLLRSRQTAQEAAQQIAIKNHGRIITARTKTNPFIGEVDFGSFAEGKPINQVRLDMALAYGAWASGNIDVRLQGGSASGREVLQRASQALSSLVHAAELEPNRHIAAISHSTFLRILLATILNISLAQAALLEQVNGCINVVDMSKHQKLELGPKSFLFGGILSQASSDFHLVVPKGTAVRINERRHLDGITTGNL